MTAFLARLLGCVAALGISALLFPGSCGLLGVLLGGGLLTVFYTFLRPLLQAVLLPFNMLLLGLLTPLTDAWLVLWASSWAGGASFSYWQAVFAAILVLVFYLPYSRQKKQRLSGGKCSV